MAKITISSNDIPADGMLPKDSKNSSLGEQNYSPHISWTGEGFVDGHVEYWNLYVLDPNRVGTGPGNKYTHWSVEGLNVSQKEITQSGGINPPATINTPDSPNPDVYNGWSGPAPIVDTEYEICIQVKIKDEHATYVFGASAPENNTIEEFQAFEDTPQNTSPDPTTGDCGTAPCPPGYTLVGTQCQRIDEAPLVVSATTYVVGEGSNNTAYEDLGLLLYSNIDNLPLPLSASGGILIDASNNPAPYTTHHQADAGIFAWGSGAVLGAGNSNNGRLNVFGTWTTGAPNPIDEWIGFTACINVPTTKQYCIGLSVDNRMRFKLNGKLIAQWDNDDTFNFRYYSIVPITLNQGNNILSLEALNDGGDAAFIAEIFDATPAQLRDAVDFNAVTAYAIYSTWSKLGSNMDVGEDSGFICPEGFSYDACNGTGKCLKITYTNPDLIECCWRIRNCDDSNEEYLIKIHTAETKPFFQNNVYTLAGNTVFTSKCWLVVNEEICLTPDYDNVLITTDHGRLACAACSPSEKFESCDNPGTYIYITVPAGGLVVGNVYDFTELFTGCYTYIGQDLTIQPTAYGMTVDNDYGVSDCTICDPCHRFRNCETAAEFVVSIDSNETVTPVVGNIYDLSADPGFGANTGCWEYVGQEVCASIPTITNITIVYDYSCDECGICTPYYKLTNCEDSNDTMFIWWDLNEPDLDPTHAYIFDFETDKCWTPIRDYTPCSQTGTVYTASNILTDSTNGCTECNAVCYKLIDCETYQTVATSDDFSAYEDKVIQWQDEADAPNYTIRCATVESYICRRETYPMPDITVLNCYNSCTNCLPVDPVEEPFTYTKRFVKPGYTVPDCVEDECDSFTGKVDC